ncbi:MAG: glycerophosphodiester phosphodiesterase [Alphaproteobacteria bacterium]|nr:glycerophosphodiester phosphodiesterase [Alphaproteobacteria bacterium]
MGFRFPRVVGHRGASADAPENTLAAFRLAAEQGAGAIELDAKLSADGVPVVIHDDTLDRTTNGHGDVRAHAFAVLDRIDAGSWFDRCFAGEKLPTLEATLKLCQALGLELNIEIKPCPGRVVETAEKVVADIRRFWPTNRPAPLLSCFDPDGLAAARAADSALPRGFLVNDLDDAAIKTAQRLDCVALHVRHVALDRTGVAAIKEASLVPVAWTVNQPARAVELVAWGVASIISDRPDAIRKALG